MAMTVSELADLVGGEVAGDPDLEITAVSSVASASPDTIVFAETPADLEEALDSFAGAVVTPPGAVSEEKSLIGVDHPRLAFVVLASMLHPTERPDTGIHPTAVVDETADIGLDAVIGPHVTVEAGAMIGNGVVLGPGCTVGAGARIGADSRLIARVTLYPGVTLGERVLVHAGVVIGADGFGFVDTPEGKVKFPQLGTVIVEDDVEIGANSTIDRGALDATVIGRGTKIDNLVQIGHNVRIGLHCAISAQTGIGGTATIGNRVVMGGQVGIADHAVLEGGAVIAAQSGVAPHKVLPGNAVYLGSPVRPLRQAKRLRGETALLPKLRARLADALKRIEALEGGGE